MSGCVESLNLRGFSGILPAGHGACGKGFQSTRSVDDAILDIEQFESANEVLWSQAGGGSQPLPKSGLARAGSVGVFPRGEQQRSDNTPNDNPMKLKYTALIAFAASMFFVACETETAVEDDAGEMDTTEETTEPAEPAE